MLRIFVGSLDFDWLAIGEKLGAANESNQSAPAGSPKGAVGFFDDRVGGRLGWKPVCREGLKLISAIEVSKGIPIEGEPETAARTEREGLNVLAVPAVAIRDGGAAEISSVEADKAVLGGHPQETIGGLGNGPDAIKREAVLAAPALEVVLKDSPGWVQGIKLRPKQEKSNAEQELGPKMQAFSQ